MTYSAGMQVEILLPLPFDHGFDYRVPDGMQLVCGQYVRVPFGRRHLTGVVWGEGSRAPDKCKPVAEAYTHVPAVSQTMRRFIAWSAAYYLQPAGLCLKMLLTMPQALSDPPTRTVYRPGVLPAKLSAARQRVIDRLGDSAARDALLDVASAATLRAMVKDGQLIARDEPAMPAAQSFTFAASPTLSGEQEAAASALKGRLGRGFSANVLDGVTGSGKTEVYFEVIEAVLQQTAAPSHQVGTVPEKRRANGQILVLLPEIVLTVQWLARCEARFGARPFIWHSNMSQAQRKQAWLAIANGTARLVVGARSALYLPYRNLQAVIVDEEHETSYKQEEGVPYQARDMAVARAHQEEVPAILVSATPSLETVYNIAQGKYHEFRLRRRHGTHGAAPVELIDGRQHKPERQSWLSPPLLAALTESWANRQQSLLFLNRRGYAPLVLCRNCGFRFQCEHCSAWLVQHQHPPRLECHHCGHRQPMPPACPQCGEQDQLVACGPGVERVHEEVAQRFPEARLAVLTGDDSGLAEQIARIIRHEVDIIIGTQLVAKGHHFPQLGLVGIIDADLGLSGGDLRACEHTFQLLHQLAGRAGRESVAGRVLLQTCQPEHPVLQAMAAGNRDGFVQAELTQRRRGGWPPYGRLAALLLDGKQEQVTARAARELVRHAPQREGVRVLGPAPAPLSKLKDHYRFRLLVKAPRELPLQHYLRAWLSAAPLPRSVRLKVDIDPYYFL